MMLCEQEQRTRENISEHSSRLGRKGLTPLAPSARRESSGGECVIRVSLIHGT